MKKNASDHAQLIGSALMFLGSIFYSSKAVIVKLVYRFDVEVMSLLALRMLFALPFYVGILFWNKKKTDKKPLKGKMILRIMVIGLTGYYLASLFDFMGLKYIPAGLERLILFTYPTLVVLIMTIGFRKKMTRATILALLLTYVGIALAFLNSPSDVPVDQLYLGGGLVFLAALSFAIYMVWSAKLVHETGTIRFTAIGMIGASIAILLHNGLLTQSPIWGLPANVYWLTLLMAVVSTVFPSFLVMEAIRRIGPSKSAIIGSVGPISTIVLAYYFLGESFGGWQLIGALIVIVGILLISLDKK